MAIRNFDKKKPNIGSKAYIDETALLIGDVDVGEDCSIWPMVVVRGDVHSIKIGKRTNIQDASVIHVTSPSEYYREGFSCVVGDDVTVGHRVTLHACEVGNLCLIGMSSTIMDGAIIEDKVIVGAGSLVSPNKRLESGYLYVGSPVKKVRKLNEKELLFLVYSAKHYVELKDLHKQ